MIHAAAAAAEITAGRLAPEDVLDEAERAFQSREPEIQAFLEADFGAARHPAPTRWGPLVDLPFAAKDNFNTRRFPTRHGSAIYKDHQPDEDALVVRMAEKQGGALVGKTAMTEFALFTASATRNPHDVCRTPGGSSSGSAAAVAAGMLAFAFGTQTAGSVIRPASFCGVAAYKPTFGDLPMTGVKALAPSMDTVGLFAASVVDLAFVVGALTAQRFVPEQGAGAPRIGICTSWAGLIPSDDMQVAVDAAVRAAERSGASIASIRLPAVVSTAHHVHATVMAYEAVQTLAQEHRHPAAISPRLLEYLDRASGTTEDEYNQAQDAVRIAHGAVQDVFRDVDVLLAPSAPGPAPEGLADTGSSEFNRLWTILGLPVINVSGLSTRSGLPLGLQIIGPPDGDASAFAVAAFVERAIQT